MSIVELLGLVATFGVWLAIAIYLGKRDERRRRVEEWKETFRLTPEYVEAMKRLDEAFTIIGRRLAPVFVEITADISAFGASMAQASAAVAKLGQSLPRRKSILEEFEESIEGFRRSLRSE